MIAARDLQLMLGQIGYPMSTVVTTGEEALKSIESLAVNLILMDIGLSRGLMDGVETAERIRAKKDIPIVYLTARSDEQTVTRAKHTEPFGYVVKPYHNRELLAAIELALYLHQMKREVKLSFNWLITTLNSIADAVIATDTSGMTKYMNPEAEHLTGWRASESYGKPISEILYLMNDATREPMQNQVLRVLAEGKKVDMPNYITLRSRSGREIPIHCTISPIFNNRMELFGAVLIFRNLYEFKKEKDDLLNLVMSAETEKRLLERYFPENLVDILVDEGRLAELGGKNVPVTVMFCDIRNSTGIAESISAANFATLLNDFFSGIMDLTYANGGSVNKLLGDGMLITFGCPIPGDSDAINCVRLALQFREYIRTFNEIKPDYLKSPIMMGIGISSGMVFAGNIGSSRHMEYTVLGDPVNTASRLEKLTKEVGCDIILDKNTYERIQDEIDAQPLGFRTVIGKKEPIEIFSPSGIL